jgi:hypothetical protein
VPDKRTFIVYKCPLLPEHVVRIRKDALFSLAAVYVGLLTSYGPAFHIRPFHVGIHTDKHEYFIINNNPERSKNIFNVLTWEKNVLYVSYTRYVSTNYIPEGLYRIA